MTGLRELNKERRRQSILDAALILLRDIPVDEVTIPKVADRAMVSVPTIYNLIGARDELLSALLYRVLESLAADEDCQKPEKNLVLETQEAIERSVQVFVSEGSAYRQIVRYLGSLRNSERQIDKDPVELYAGAMQEMQAANILRSETKSVVLGRQAYMSYFAALVTWGSGIICDDTFSVAAQYGLMTVLCANATPEHLPELSSQMQQLGDVLANSNWG